MLELSTIKAHRGKIIVLALLLAVFLYFLYLLGWSPASLPTIPITLLDKDASAKVEVLGNPYRERYPADAMIYARNIWDMAANKDMLYLGAGNSSNMGPASNAGPVPIIRFDPKRNAFDEVFTVDDEQVDSFSLIEGQLYCPGHDPRESWEWGNFYRLEFNGQWKKFRNIPDALHNYAMAWHKGKLFAGLGRHIGAGVAISTDYGESWHNTRLPNTRIHGFIPLAEDFYAVGIMPSGGLLSRFGVYQFDGGERFWPRLDIGSAALFPGQSLQSGRYVKIAHCVSVGGKAAYIGAYTHNDHQSEPFGVFVAESLSRGDIRVRRVELPEGAVPWDLLVEGEDVYLLLEHHTGKLFNIVLKGGKDLENFTEAFRFESETFARSFALLGRDFYFGLGCEVGEPEHWGQNELHPDTGTLLRIKDAL